MTYDISNMYSNEQFTISLISRSRVDTRRVDTGNNEAETGSQDNIAERLSANKEKIIGFE